MDRCDIANYVDSSVTPALVLPKAGLSASQSEFSKRGAKLGDLVVALRRAELKPVFAVVGDHGPATSLGEGSIALNGKLLGKTAEPINYRELTGKAPEFKGKAWVVPSTAVLVFTNSRNVQQPWMTSQRIDEEASQRFTQ